MTSTNIELLESLIQGQSSARDTEIRPALLRLSNEIRARVSRGSEVSLDFVEASIKTLIKLKGSANASLRMECLIDGGAFLFSNNRTASAVIAASACQSLARQTSDRELESKAESLLSM